MTIKLMNGIRLDQVMKRFGQWVHAIANGRSRRSLFLGVGTIFGYFVPLKEIRRVDYPIKSKGYRKKSTFPVECE